MTNGGTMIVIPFSMTAGLNEAEAVAPLMLGSGSAVVFANGGYQVSYNEVEAIHHSRVGDPVLMCLILIPRGCPPGDARGRWYTTTDKRTMESWTMPDAEHSCGGA